MENMEDNGDINMHIHREWLPNVWNGHIPQRINILGVWWPERDKAAS